MELLTIEQYKAKVAKKCGFTNWNELRIKSGSVFLEEMTNKAIKAYAEYIAEYICKNELTDFDVVKQLLNPQPTMTYNELRESIATKMAIRLFHFDGRKVLQKREEPTQWQINQCLPLSEIAIELAKEKATNIYMDILKIGLGEKDVKNVELYLTEQGLISK